MLPLVKPGLFNAQALSVDNNDSHLHKGNYIRLSAHPKLGLPVAPFVIKRTVTTAKDLKYRNLLRTAAVFIDSMGYALEPPFDVTPDNPVIARIPLQADEVCLWAQVLVKQPSRPIYKFIDQKYERVLNPLNRVKFLGGKRLPDTVFDSFDRVVDYSRRKKPSVGKSSLQCEAFVNTANSGLASIGKRSQHRYVFNSHNITEIKITGVGEVTGIEWIEAKELTQQSQGKKAISYFQPYAVLNLPHAGGLRYLSLPNAERRAFERVKAQAPKRRPLQETLNTPAPATAPLSDDRFESRRVASLYEGMDDDLELLLTGSDSPFAQTIEEDIIDENATPIGSNNISRLSYFNQLQIDPGTAALIGYKLYDDTPAASDDDIVIYQINGFFNDYSEPMRSTGTGKIAEWLAKLNNEDLLYKLLLNDIPQPYKTASSETVMDWYVKLTEGKSEFMLNRRVLQNFANTKRYIGISTIVIADQGSILDQVNAPTINKAEHVDWLPAIPPLAKRHVRVDLADTLVAGLLAAGKQPLIKTGQYQALNRKNARRFHMPIVLSINTNSSIGDVVSEPGTGFISDRLAVPEAIKYAVAQQDRFGRWSNWTFITAAAGPRPYPPRPQLQAFYTIPTAEAAASVGGEILIKVPVPDSDVLAPGSFLLKKLNLSLTDLSTQERTTLTILESTKVIVDSLHSNANNSTHHDPNLDNYCLMITVTAPTLEPAEQRKMRIVATWQDTNNRLSMESEPLTLVLNDPRPPAQIDIENTVQYAARPDITGVSWIEYRWQPKDKQSTFDIYYTDENRLLAQLEALGKGGILNDAATAADRAAIYREHQAFFHDALFEKLADVQVVFNAEEVGFRHGVSGSLKLLNFYKVATMASTGAKPDLKQLDMLIYAIPNTDPPASPSISVTQVPAEPSEPPYVAKVALTLESGVTPGHRWRLRRSSVSSSNIQDMLIVAQNLPLENTTTGLQTAIYRDDGSVEVAATAQLKPWVEYSWVAEVQAEPESETASSVVAGRWSRASNPVSLILAPATAPSAPSIEEIKGTTGPTGLKEVQLIVDHEDDLSGGKVGSYRIQIRRRLATEQAFAVISEVKVSGRGPFVINDVLTDLANEEVPFGTEYQVELIDPLGRISVASAIAAVNAI